MKRLFWALVALQLISLSAPAMAQRAAYNWAGCYVGASLGGLWGRSSIDNDFAVPTSVHTNPSGLFGGAQAGCDQQLSSNWLAGLQSEINWSGAHDRTTVFLPFPFVSETLDAKIDWFGSATARLGYVSGAWLLYGKGGAAWAHDHLRLMGQLSSSSFDFSADTTRLGWTLGSGLEFMFAPNWSTFLEYDYYGFGSKTTTMSGSSMINPPATPDARNDPFKQNFSILKVGLNYRFGTQ